MDLPRKLWAGRIYGTNTGKVFLELEQGDQELSGLLKLADDQFGLATYSVAGSFDGKILSLKGVPIEASPDVQLGEVMATARLQANGEFSGEWESTLGTAGTIHLFPHVGSNIAATDAGPEQLYTTVRDLGALRLFRDDIEDIITVLRKKFPSSRIVVSHIDRGAQLAQFSDEFQAAIGRLDTLKWLKLNVQAPAGGDLSKSVTIDLGEAFNRVTTQGPDESWVLGEAEATALFLKKREKRLSTVLGKYRVNLNQIIAIGALIAMPDLPIISRATFAFIVILLIILANKVQTALIPNFMVDFSRTRPNWAEQIWPSALSWIISATAGLAASVVYGLLRGWIGF